MCDVYLCVEEMLDAVCVSMALEVAVVVFSRRIGPPPRSTHMDSSTASDMNKRQVLATRS